MSFQILKKNSKIIINSTFKIIYLPFASSITEFLTMDCLKLQAVLRTGTIIAVQLISRLLEYRLTELSIIRTSINGKLEDGLL